MTVPLRDEDGWCVQRVTFLSVWYWLTLSTLFGSAFNEDTSIVSVQAFYLFDPLY